MTKPSASGPALPWPVWRRWIEPWYLAYALLGATVTGVAPMLIPLAVSRGGSPQDVGTIIAVSSLGGLLAPLWGILADRYRLHRSLLTVGLLIAAVGLGLFPFTVNLRGWLGLALLQGIGVAGAGTVANLFVVEAHPQDEWDERIGWLQTFYGGGQVLGMLLVTVMGQTDLQLGLLVAAGLTVLAAVVGWATTQTPPGPLIPKPAVLHPIRQGELAPLGPQRLYHHLNVKFFRQIGTVLRTPFSLFLVIWLCSLTGSSAFFALYPVLMQEVFDLPAGVSSFAFALAAILRLVLYAPAGRWSRHCGPVSVLQTGLGLRLLAFLGIFSLGWTPAEGQSWLVMLSLTFVVAPWSLLSVSSAALTADLSPVNEGEGMGILNAISSLAGIIGAMFGGWCAARWGYNAASGLAVAGLAVGFILALMVLPTRRENHGSAPSELSQG